MFGLLKAIGAVKVAVVGVLLTAVLAAGAVQPNLPDASASGQDHAAAGAANGQSDGQPNVTAPDTQAVTDQLGTNQTRLLDTLSTVQTQLTDNGADQHALDALGQVVDLLANGDVGLNHATDVVNGDHPGAGDHPSAGDHPDANDHPSGP